MKKNKKYRIFGDVAKFLHDVDSLAFSESGASSLSLPDDVVEYVDLCLYEAPVNVRQGVI